MIVKRRDRRYLMWQVTNPETGEVQDLTAATVRLLVRPQYSAGEATPYSAEVHGDPTQGIVRYWYDGTITEGTYEIESEATMPGTPGPIIITSPTEGYNILQVEPDLG